MYGLLSSLEFYGDMKEALAGETIIFEKHGAFGPDAFVQICQSAAHVQLQALLIDMGCTDESSLIKGIQNYRLTCNTRIILIAPNRVPGDPTISMLLSLKVWDIVAPNLQQLSEAGEDGEEGQWPSIAPHIKNQLKTPLGYGNAARWDVRVEQAITSKSRQDTLEKQQKSLEKKIQKINGEDPFTDHIDIELPRPKTVEKLLLMETIIGSILVAVIGAEPAAGTTHTAILVTNYLVRKGYKIAVIEASNKEDFAALEYAYEGRKGFASKERKFHMEGADYYKSASQYLDLSQFKDYDYIVLDLGCYQDTSFLEEFKRAHVQIVVGHGSEWRQQKIHEFSKATRTFDQSRFIYCIPLADKQIRGDIAKELATGRVYAIPAHPDPYRYQRDTDVLLESFMKEFLGQRRSRIPSLALYVVIGLAIVVIIILAIMLINK